MIYFDNAATSFPKPLPVVKAVSKAITFYGGNPGRSGHKMSIQASEMVYNTRETAAEFFGTAPENVVFTSNCTHALNIAIKGSAPLGSNIIISDLEHNSVARPVHTLSIRGKASYSIARTYPGDPQKTVASFERLIRKDTRVIACTHASNVTGDVLPIADIAAMAHKHNLVFIADAAQTAGVIPINMEEMGIDMLCCAGHKSLYGPTGTGMLLFGSNEIKLPTLIEGGGGSNSLEFFMPEFTPDRFEAGTLNTVGIHALGEGIRFIQKKGLNNIYEHEIKLINLCYQQLSKVEGVILYGGINPGEKAPVLPFNIKGRNSEETAAELDKAGFALRAGLHCAPLAHQKLGTIEIGVVRFAPGVFTTVNDVYAFCGTVKRIAKNAG